MIIKNSPCLDKISYQLQINHSKEDNLWEIVGYIVNNGKKDIDGARIQFTNFEELVNWLGKNCKW